MSYGFFEGKKKRKLIKTKDVTDDTALASLREKKQKLTKIEHLNNNIAMMKIEDLTDDTLMEILSRLPFRAAYQCKAVSKRWLSLISSIDFTHHYRSVHDCKDIFYMIFKIYGVFCMNHYLHLGKMES